MKKVLILLIGILVSITVVARQNELPVRGQVVNKAGEPLVGAAVYDIESKKGAITQEDGQFTFNLPRGDYDLRVSMFGYETTDLKISVPLNQPLQISLEEKNVSLSAVEIVSTGYQELPKERATGSFVVVDEDLVNRRISTNLIDRLEDVTSGLIINRQGGVGSVSIRGRTTFGVNSSPLIVIDGFPYDGPLESINPNDVEQVTVLKDAAAASIWGTRAGNGVIVITTRKGQLNEPMRVSFTSNLTTREAPDLFYRPVMRPEDYLDLERTLFEEGVFNADVNATDRRALSPGIQLLLDRQNGVISESAFEDAFGFLRQSDLRRDLTDYAYRSSMDQQYNLSIRGGSAKQAYQVSLGYDHNLEALEGNDRNRITLNAGQQLSLLNDRLKINTNIFLVNNSSSTPNQLSDRINLTQSTFLPIYTPLVDAVGNPISTPRDFRPGLKDQALAEGLLPWDYVPLSDYNAINNTSSRTEYRINTGAQFELAPFIKLDAMYQYWTANGQSELLYGADSYFARDLVNRFTEVNPNGTLTRRIPLGGIQNNSFNRTQHHNGRLQAVFSKTWQEKHQLNALAGVEYRQLDTQNNNYRVYGYDARTRTGAPVAYTIPYPFYHNNSQGTIPFNDSQRLLTDRFFSYYGNVGYTYDNRIDVTMSARKDQSNLFGVNSNQRGVPLWSAGIGWTISEEAWYGVSSMPYLKLRGTFGYSGNVDNSLTAFTTTRRLIVSPLSNLPGSEITNPPNPDLIWERVRILNFGVDFESKNGRVSGTFEYFTKDGLDLIGSIVPIPSSGENRFFGNTADVQTQGFDFQLRTINIDGAVQWTTDWLYSYQNDEVGVYERDQNAFLTIQNATSNATPISGYPLYPVFSYPWAGLDGQTGDPLFLLDGEPSNDYNTIFQSLELEDLVFNGSARPRTFGSVRNTLNYKGFSLSANISFRFQYYFRKPSISYGGVRGLGGDADYYDRWQQPGDESRTYVPSIPQANNQNRDRLYTFSSVLVEPGDHVRLQDIRIGYQFTQAEQAWLPFKSVNVYAYLNNVGILWKKTAVDIDPDFLTNRPLRSYSFGARFDF